MLLLLIVLLGLTGIAESVPARQQERLVDLPGDATDLARFALDPETGRATRLGVGTLFLSPGQSTIPLRAHGTAALVVQRGTLVIAADRSLNGTHLFGDGTSGQSLPELDRDPASDGTGDRTDDPFPDAVESRFFRLEAGDGAIIGMGVRIRIIASGEEPVQILFVSAVTRE